MSTNKQNIATTLSVHANYCNLLKDLAKKSGVSANHIIIYCLTRYSNEIKISLTLHKSTQYQSRCKKYKAFHLKLPPILYEKCFDLRKSLKFSLSLIFAIAFNAYLKDLSRPAEIDSSPAERYSYHENIYNASYFHQNERHIFTYCWEKPPD